jgi:hypothetical protein
MDGGASLAIHDEGARPQNQSLRRRPQDPRHCKAALFA